MWVPTWFPGSPLRNSLLILDPPAHTRVRALAQRAFGPRAMAILESRSRAIAAELTGRLAADREIDLINDFAIALPGRIIIEICGLDPGLQVHFKRWGAAVAAMGISDPALIAQVRTDFEEMIRHLRAVVEERRRHPADDIVTELLEPDPTTGDRMTDDEVLAFLATILPAGFETSAGLLANVLRFLALRPQDFSHLRARPEFIPQYLEEVLRYEPVAQTVARICQTEVEVAGVRLAAGSVVLVLVGSANRDETKFPDPDVFDPDRFAPGKEGAKHLSFSHGIHYCLGAALARAECRIGIEALLARCEQLRMGPAPIEWTMSLSVRIPVSLPARLSRRLAA
ncbi:MAG TPA: cytochrome P450 [Polyangia bacterium]|nr:cytochrome P450 [Polyangia bacterium]